MWTKNNLYSFSTLNNYYRVVVLTQIMLSTTNSLFKKVTDASYCNKIVKLLNHICIYNLMLYCTKLKAFLLCINITIHVEISKINIIYD